MKAFILSIVLLLMACGESKSPTGGDLIPESTLDASVSGFVYDVEDSSALENITITAEPGGYTTTSLADGSFTIPKMEKGTYTLTYSSLLHKSQTQEIQLAEDQDLKGLAAYLSLGASDDLIQLIGETQKRTINGKLLNVGDTETMKLFFKMDTGIVEIGQFTVNTASGEFNKVINMPISGGEAHIHVFNSMGLVTGFLSANFDKSADDIELGEFDALNATPAIEPSLPIVMVQSESITLEIDAQDTLGATAGIDSSYFIIDQQSISTVPYKLSFSSAFDSVRVIKVAIDYDGNQVKDTSWIYEVQKTELVQVDSATFTFHDYPQGPSVDTVVNQSFQMQKFEVTQQDYLLYLVDLNSQNLLTVVDSFFVSEGNSLAKVSGSGIDISTHGKLSTSTPNQPIHFVSLVGAQQYASWLSTKFSTTLNSMSYQIPSELEWNFAALGGRTPDATTYSGSDVLNEVAWNTSNGNLMNPEDVGTLQANSLGLFDMSGNVEEWVGTEQRFRGGSIYSTSTANSFQANHSAIQLFGLEADKHIGFRLILK